MKTYTLFWTFGETQLVHGDSPADAMNKAGLGAGTLRTLDFYAEGDVAQNYKWIEQNHVWEKMVQEDL